MQDAQAFLARFPLDKDGRHSSLHLMNFMTALVFQEETDEFYLQQLQLNLHALEMQPSFKSEEFAKLEQNSKLIVPMDPQQIQLMKKEYLKLLGREGKKVPPSREAEVAEITKAIYFNFIKAKQ